MGDTDRRRQRSGTAPAGAVPPLPRKAYLNGLLWTGDPARPEASAMLVEGERLVVVGSDAEIRSRIGPEVESIDLRARRVVPGFIDAHWHFTAETHAGLYGAGHVAEMQRRLLERAARTPGDGWVCDGGWAYAEFPHGVPHRRYLDEILPDRPVWIAARDGHMGVANSLALELAGIGVATPQPRKGRFVKDARGELTGELTGLAVYRVQDLIPPPSEQACAAKLAEQMRLAAANGITSAHNLQGWYPHEQQAVIEACRDGTAALRLYASVWLDGAPNGFRSPRTPKGLQTAFGSMLRFGGAKAVLDGTIDAGTAAMREPLTDGRTGFSYFTQQRLNDCVVRAEKRGLQVMLHACGDAAIEQALNAFEHAAAINGPLARERRHRIEHCDVPSPRDIERMRRLGVVVCSQPNFAYPDSTNLENYAVLLGPERTARSQAYRAIDAAGIVQAFASDYPVSSMDVLRSIHTAVTRRTREGTPADGWNASQAISIEAALRHFTVDAAYAGFDDGDKGRLAPGLLADFVVLSEDILAGPPERLLKAQVEQTVLGGRVVFDRATAEPALLRRATEAPLPRGNCPHCRWAGFGLRRKPRRSSIARDAVCVNTWSPA